MSWVRIHPMIKNWAGGGPPPVFDISSDENGTAVVELAWDPQSLVAPATYSDPLRYYNSDTTFSESLTNDDGSRRTVNVPSQTIQLVGNRAQWIMPQPLWDAYLQESLKTIRLPPASTFSRNIYYRVRVTPPGSSNATSWPPEATLQHARNDGSPHISMAPLSASPSAMVVPDDAAVTQMGGIPLIPNLFAEMLRMMWKSLPESDTSRQALVRIFAHANFQGANLQTRANILKLWLFGGKESRKLIPALLSRRTVIGSGVEIPIIEKTDLRGGKTLVENLLRLLAITPHPDLNAVISQEHLLDDVITEILDPNGQVNQGAAGTCSPTSMQTLLITVNPAEYARLQVGWLSSSGTSELANGAAAPIPPGIYTTAASLTGAGVGGNAGFLIRTYAELAFQSAILQYGQGSNFPAFTGTPASLAQTFQALVAGGFAFNETERALSGIFNTHFTTHYIPMGAGVTQAQWQAAQQPIRDGLVRDLPGRQQQMLMAMFWGAPYSAGHVVLGIRAESGRVFYKNPQYPGSNPPIGYIAGGTNSNPPRRYEDPSNSLESISQSDLLTWIKGYWVPDTAII